MYLLLFFMFLPSPHKGYSTLQGQLLLRARAETLLGYTEEGGLVFFLSKLAFRFLDAHGSRIVFHAS